MSVNQQYKRRFIKKREELKSKYLIEENFIQKYEISRNLIEISEKLRDDEKFIEYQTEAKSLKDEIKDRKLRLNCYLDKKKNH